MLRSSGGVGVRSSVVNFCCGDIVVNMDVEEVKEKLLDQMSLLKDVRDLQEICNGLGVNIPLPK